MKTLYFFFSIRLTKLGNGLLRLVEPPALELFKIQLEKALITLLDLQNYPSGILYLEQVVNVVAWHCVLLFFF